MPYKEVDNSILISYLTLAAVDMAIDDNEQTRTKYQDICKEVLSRMKERVRELSDFQKEQIAEGRKRILERKSELEKSELNMNMNFSDIVKSTMEQKELRNADLSRLTGYSAQYISDLISGERRRNEDVINKVCVALGISIKYEDVEGEETEKAEGGN